MVRVTLHIMSSRFWKKERDERHLPSTPQNQQTPSRKLQQKQFITVSWPLKSLLFFCHSTQCRDECRVICWVLNARGVKYWRVLVFIDIYYWYLLISFDIYWYVFISIDIICWYVFIPPSPIHVLIPPNRFECSLGVTVLFLNWKRLSLLSSSISKRSFPSNHRLRHFFSML